MEQLNAASFQSRRTPILVAIVTLAFWVRIIGVEIYGLEKHL